MKKIQINCNTNGKINIDDNARISGICIALIDEKHLPVARYEFNRECVSQLTKLLYEVNNVRIHFYGDIKPSMISEIASGNC